MTIATSLLEAFSVLPDPRLARGKEHRWSELLFIAVCTLLTGGESFYDMEEFACLRQEWLRTFLVLPGGVPSHDTFNRLFQALDPAAFAETFATWTEGLRAALPKIEREIVAVDGKAARRALDAGADARYLVSAWATENGLTLGQVQVADKSNEITAVPALLRALELTGCIVTADALHCQKNTAKEIKEADADYVLALKANQGVAHQEIKNDLDDAIARADPKLATFETIEKGHGRIETRRFWQSADIGWLTDRGQWEACKAWESWRPPATSAAKPAWSDATILQPARGCGALCPGRARPLGH
jgi:predicted transposase YbfD/YdcC